MDERERGAQDAEFDLEDILREFAAPEDSPLPDDEQVTALLEEELRREQFEQAEPTAMPEEQETPDIQSAPEEQQNLGDTVRLDTISDVKPPRAEGISAQPLSEEAEQAPGEEKPEAFSDGWEPEYDETIGEYIPPQPIPFVPRSRLHELKRKLIAGPEKRYYELVEQGTGKLQAAVFLSLLVVLLSAGATVLYAVGAVQENRLRLMVFGQFFAMLVSALLGSGQIIDGLASLFHGRFTLNTMLAFTFAACCADGIFGLMELRVPCCAAFSLEVTMSLWSAYERRMAEQGQMDTMRKAVRLDGVVRAENYCNGSAGFLRGEGQVEDFMDHYAETSRPEKIQSVYAVCALLASAAAAVAAGILHGVSLGVQVLSVSMLAAVPATAFISLTRPAAVLERRLHKLGTVICGWKGVAGLSGAGVFPLTHGDLFPAGAVKINGVKFYGSRNTDQVVEYSAAMVCAAGGGLVPLFSGLLESRNGKHYDVESLNVYTNGGIGGEVNGEPVLIGVRSFMKEMGVEIPEGTRVDQAVYAAIDGELCGLFALSYARTRFATAGLSTLCGYRGLNPMVVADDFALTESFLRAKFGIRSRRFCVADPCLRENLASEPPEQEALALMTQEGLAPAAYAVTGARALRTASIWGLAIHMTGGIVGLVIMALLAVFGRADLLTPANLFLYQLVWMLPGFLATEWTRSI